MAIISRWIASLILAASLTACQGEAAQNQASSKYTDDNMSNADAASPPADRETVMTSKYNLPGCDEIAVAAPDATAMANQFDKTYPKELIGVDTVEQVELTMNDTLEIVTYLTCAGARSNYDIGVMESSLALFDSKRHGATAFSALENIAIGNDKLAQDAKTYSEKVAQFLAGPGE